MAHNWEEKKRTSDVEIEKNISFDKMMLSDRVLQGLNKNGFTNPSPIQLRAIPLGISGLDILMQAKSGTGKTLVFATIVLENFRNDIKAPQSLILTPTRELAVQVEQILNIIGTESAGFHVSSFIGGLDVVNDRKQLQKCKSIVGTPGRIVHLIKNNVLNTSKIRILVLDEIDKLLTGTFPKDIDFIFKSLPKKRQVIGSSATYDKGVEIAMKEYMKNPIGVTAKKEAPILLGVKQFVYNLEGENLKQMQEMFQKVKVIVSILSTMSFKQCLIFSCSQQRAESYSNYLSNEGWPCEVIMGSQEQSTRLNVFKKFKEFKCRILVATDLMARGIDSENVNLVINLEVPNESSLYLHRIGRCGRFGSHGIAITLVHNNDELVKFRKLLGTIGGSEMKVLQFPKQDPSDIWNFGDPDADLKLYGEISGVTTAEMKKIDKIRESDDVNVVKAPEIVRKNLDLLEITRLLVDKPENNQSPPDEDLFESYSMVVNGSFNASEVDGIPVSTTNNNSIDVNRQFIDAISRLNLYPEETFPNVEQPDNLSKNVNQSTNGHDVDLNSNTDGSNVGSPKSSPLDSDNSEYYSGSDSDNSDEYSCSYRQSESDEDGTSHGHRHRSVNKNLDGGNQFLNNHQNWKTDIETKWNHQFMHQISLIRNYVDHTRSMNSQCLYN